MRVGDRKLYLGPRLRVLRRELGLNQTRMAEELGVSPSYLNHLERNQRPLTAQMLLRLAEAYDIDVRSFVSGANEAAASDLHEVMADSLVRDIGVTRQEIMEVAENYPSMAEAIRRFYRALSDLRQIPEKFQSASTQGVRLSSPLSWLRDFIDARRNHFAEIDLAAEALSQRLGSGPEALRAAMEKSLKEDHRISVAVVPDGTLLQSLRHYDYHRRRLLLSERLPMPSRAFGIAYQLAQEALRGPIDTTLQSAEPPDEEARTLGRIALTDYAAAALLAPYGAFQAAAEAQGYDVDLLMSRFGISYEQAAHRLTTLGRQGSRGIPFFMLKIDVAGNVSKRFAGELLPLARFGGGCPRWRVHRAYRRPGETVSDFAEMPDGSRYFTFARLIARVGAAEPAAIVLGCEARHMDRIAYARGLSPAGDQPNLIGPACHICERIACPERSLPPITRGLDLNPHERPSAPYPFREI